MTDKDERPKPPTCTNKRTTDKNTKRTCGRDGVHCWISGEFGRTAHVLCQPCIIELRARGWKVRYQLEGDNPAPLEQPHA